MPSFSVFWSVQYTVFVLLCTFRLVFNHGLNGALQLSNEALPTEPPIEVVIADPKDPKKAAEPAMSINRIGQYIPSGTITQSGLDVQLCLKEGIRQTYQWP